MNLRGLTESATVLSYPVYLFILGLIVMIVIGTWKVATGQAEPSYACDSRNHSARCHIIFIT